MDSVLALLARLKRFYPGTSFSVVSSFCAFLNVCLEGQAVVKQWLQRNFQRERRLFMTAYTPIWSTVNCAVHVGI
jgi:hypothetical protein